MKFLNLKRRGRGSEKNAQIAEHRILTDVALRDIVNMGFEAGIGLISTGDL
jgi:hypothetical protein